MCSSTIHFGIPRIISEDSLKDDPKRKFGMSLKLFLLTKTPLALYWSNHKLLIIPVIILQQICQVYQDTFEFFGLGLQGHIEYYIFSWIYRYEAEEICFENFAID